MKHRFALTIVLILLGIFPFSLESRSRQRPIIEFEGKVLQIGEKPPFLSGARQLTFQLVEYEVIRVIKGRYAEKKIIVDHVIFSGTELENVKVGDTVRVIAERSKTTPLRTNSSGIREPSDVVKVFYFGKSINSNTDR